MDNKILKIIIAGIIFCMALMSCTKQDHEKISAAQKSANVWMALIDEGQYGKSWDESASLFQKAVNKSEWEKKLSCVREPLGKLVFRNIKSSRYFKSLPGAPDGEYVVIRYKTSYENKKKAIETVTPMLDKDGKWRVSGYYIK